MYQGKAKKGKKKGWHLTFNQVVMGSNPIEITLNINGLHDLTSCKPFFIAYKRENSFPPCNLYARRPALNLLNVSNMPDAHLLTDPDGFALAEACHAGDRQAQRDLWMRHKNRMFGVCLRLAGSRQEAEDWLQEAFVQVFRDIGQYRGEGSLEGWVRRIVFRTALQHFQKQRFYIQQLDDSQLEKILAATEQNAPIDNDEPGRLVALLQYLPPGFRTVLNLYILEERSHEEIARELGISIGTSKSQLHRAKAFMRRLLDKTLLLL